VEQEPGRREDGKIWGWLGHCHQAQVLAYLRLTELRVGLLVSFHSTAIKRAATHAARQIPVFSPSCEFSICARRASLTPRFLSRWDQSCALPLPEDDVGRPVIGDDREKLGAELIARTVPVRAYPPPSRSRARPGFVGLFRARCRCGCRSSYWTSIRALRRAR
jgi:hypothetical protein